MFVFQSEFVRSRVLRFRGDLSATNSFFVLVLVLSASGTRTRFFVFSFDVERSMFNVRCSSFRPSSLEAGFSASAAIYTATNSFFVLVLVLSASGTRTRFFVFSFDVERSMFNVRCSSFRPSSLEAGFSASAAIYPQRTLRTKAARRAGRLFRSVRPGSKKSLLPCEPSRPSRLCGDPKRFTARFARGAEIAEKEAL